MNVKPPVFEMSIYKCLFCEGLLDFELSESFGSGLIFICPKCKKKYVITNYEE